MIELNEQNTENVGKVLIITAVMYWLYRNNLNSLNNLILFIIVIWAISAMLMRTKLFTKKEIQRFRRTKVVSLVISILVMLLVVTATIVINFFDEIGAESSEYNSSNYNGDSFHNLNHTEVSSGSTSEVLLDYLVFDPNRTPNSIIPTEEFEIQELMEDEVSITWFGHSTILIQSPNYNILVDPLFGENSMGPLFLGPTPFDFENTYEIEDLPEIDIVLISHDHYDHLDMRTVVEFKDSTFLTPLGVKPHLELWGIPSKNIKQFDWYEGTNISEELQITLTPSQHFSGRSINEDDTLWGSWVIELGDKSIFFSGDGGYSAEFKTIGDLYGPFDIAIVEAGQYNEAWSQIHMFPSETVQASIDLNSNMVMPIHNSKFELSLHHWDEPLKEVTAEGAKRNHLVATPLIGQSFILGEEVPDYHWWNDVASEEEPFLKSNTFVGLFIPVDIVIGVILIRNSRLNAYSEDE